MSAAHSVTQLCDTGEDQTFALKDGHYAIVAGRVFGPWANKGLAEAGLQTEQRRYAIRFHSRLKESK